MPKKLIRSKRPVEINCVDLFCGVGGLTHGLVRQGINVVCGIDNDPQCKFPYEKNNKAKFLLSDIKELNPSEVSRLFPSTGLKLLAGCAPCQPFSTYSQTGRSLREDDKWQLLSHFGNLVDIVQPDLVTMENVPQLLHHPIYRQFLKQLDGYNIWSGVVRCEDYGIPQTRKRLVLVASRAGEVELAKPEDISNKGKLSVRAAISHLPRLEAGGTCKTDPLHSSPRLSPINMKRIKASTPGGTWRDWDEALLADCHRKKSGETYPSVYGRMQWEKPSPTITTQCFGFGNGRFGHPEQDRAISLREAAILQSFPEKYQFIGKNEKPRFNSLGRLIGNAVPVRLGELVGRSLLKSVSLTS